MRISFDRDGDKLVVDSSPERQARTITFPIPPAERNGWRSVAVVLNGEDVQVYVDGEEQKLTGGL